MRVSTLLVGFLYISIFSGCVGGMLQKSETISTQKDEIQEVKKHRSDISSSPQIVAENMGVTTTITPQSTTITQDYTNKSPVKNPTEDVECQDSVIEEKKSNCDRGLISEEELKNSKNKRGNVHTLKSIRGKTIHIIERPTGFIFPEYEGKVILLEFFGKDCPHCLNELPVIKKIRDRYKGKLEVIAIQAQNRMSLDEARDYINGHMIKYPIIEGEDAIDLQHFVQKTYEWRGILPYTLVIKDGVTEFFYEGEFDYKEIKKDLDSLFYGSN